MQLSTLGSSSFMPNRILTIAFPAGMAAVVLGSVISGYEAHYGGEGQSGMDWELQRVDRLGWPLTYFRKPEGGDTEIDPPALLVDLPLVVLLAASIFHCLRYCWRRRRSLSGLLLFAALASASCAAAAGVYRAGRSCERLEDALSGAEVIKEVRLPRWVIQLCPALSRHFQVVVAAELDGSLAPKLANAPHLVALRINGELFSRDDLRSLESLPNLQYVTLAYSNIAGNSNRLDSTDLVLPGITNARLVSLYDASYSGAGLEKISSVEYLDLSHTSVDRRAMEKIATLRHLRALSLDSTEVNGGLEGLVDIRCLEELSLGNTLIGDREVRCLKRMPQLRRLALQGTAVTRGEVARLQMAIPSCEIGM